MMSVIRPNRILASFFLVTLFTIATFAQDEKSPPEKPPILQVRVTEYALNSPIDPNLSNSELLDKITAASKSARNQSSGEQPFAIAKNVLRFTHLVGIESNIQVGRTVSVIVGETRDPRGGVMRNSTMKEIGTLAKLKTTPTESGVILAQITYESSDLEVNQPDSISPEFTQLTIDSTIVLETGKTVLLLGTDGRSPRVITVTFE
jgi:hypothetical protein